MFTEVMLFCVCIISTVHGVKHVSDKVNHTCLFRSDRVLSCQDPKEKQTSSTNTKEQFQLVFQKVQRVPNLDVLFIFLEFWK